MFKWAALGALICVAVAFYAGYAKRASWIKEKIASLSAPASFIYMRENASLPAKASKPRIVLIGDSRVAQWPREGFPAEWEIVNRGIGGETAAQLMKRFQADALALNPDVIVISTGMNDLVAASLMESDKREEVARSTAAAIQNLATQGMAAGHRVLVTTIIPPARVEFLRLPVWNESLPDLVAEVNAALKQARWPDGATLVDLSTSLTGGSAKVLPDKYRDDTLHVNAIAYQQLTEALRQSLQGAIGAGPLRKAS
jgi:lysophospholipase L1-like esterase